MRKITFLILACLVSTVTFAQISINEIDADQTSTDVGEFIELKSDSPNASLDGYVVVLFNGSSDQSYAAFDLDGFTTDANGFLLLANDGFPGMDISLGPDNGLQNGADAVAIYQANGDDFPADTPATTANLVAALVYGTGDADDTDLLAALGETMQYDEDMNGLKDVESIQNAGDGTFCVGTPTPNLTNIDCGTVCPLNVYVDQVACDATTNGTDTYTVTLGFSGGGVESYTITTTSGTVGGDDPSTDASGFITISGMDEGIDITYTITSTLCNIVDDITAPSCEPANQVSTIAELKNGTVGETYMLVGEVLLTYQQDFRNQKYIEDATAGILIDDSDGNLTTAYNIGDGISSITGELSEFDGVLQFVPESDAGAPTSTGNTLTPQTVTVTDLANNPADYDAELVQVMDATVTSNDSGITTWVVGTVYNLSTNNGSYEFRTSFYDADYIDQDLPSTPLNITGIITRDDADDDNMAEYYLTARSSADMETLSVESNFMNNLSIYPNPVSNGIVNIETALKGSIEVEIFNLLGKQVISTEITNGSVNISALQSGVYLMKIIQNGNSATKKLIVN
ncbi:MAG TPA: T9SS type A sorting domain-containing protein [Flavobacteriaceae bacterium]|nr:T9SS type A sorting domain-containing protein [Flavobacteriaceae bacterium]